MNNNVSIQEKLGRLFFIGLPHTTLTDETKRVLDTIKPGSIILFSRNIENPEQLRKYVDDINAFLGYEPVFCADQEGGIVSRFRHGFSVAPGAMAVSATNNPKNAEETGFILGKEMRSLGVNWNLAPVVDINSFPKNPGIGVRSYGDTVQKVIEYAHAFITGMHKAGICSCIKHFPGLGRVSIDPHIGRPEIPFSKKELLDTELRPYLELKADSIMPSHAFYSALQSFNEPASVSKEVLTDFARKELGLNTLFVADALTMGGVTETIKPSQAAIKALTAGMDFLSFCHNSEEQQIVFKETLQAVQKSEILQNRLEESFIRVDAFMEYAQKNILQNKDVISPLPLTSVGSKEHIEIMENITIAGITLKNTASTINFHNYLQSLSAIYGVILSRPVEAEEGPEENEAPYIARHIAQVHAIPLYTFPENPDQKLIKKLVDSAPKDTPILIFTEDALVHSAQEQLVGELCKKNLNHLVIALRNPYDVWLPHVNEAIMTYGYEKISQLALLEILNGNKKAEGTFPLQTNPFQ